jgi:hypothetical protein
MNHPKIGICLESLGLPLRRALTEAGRLGVAGVQVDASKPELICPEPHPDTDVTALTEGWITVTPLQFELTQAVLLEQMGQWQWRL